MPPDAAELQNWIVLRTWFWSKSLKTSSFGLAPKDWKGPRNRFAPITKEPGGERLTSDDSFLVQIKAILIFVITKQFGESPPVHDC